MNALPRELKDVLVNHYLFDDIFYRFRLFFGNSNQKDTKFLYDISFGLRPRQYGSSEQERVILDEENEVNEMYFIMEGIVGIGFYSMTQELSKKQYHNEGNSSINAKEAGV